MRPSDSHTPTVYLVSSPGGHLSELLELGPAFEDCTLHYFCYASETTARLPNVTLVPNAPYNPLRYPLNLYRLLRLFQRHRPILVVSTGAEIALPAFLAAKLLRIPTVYVECGAQVTQPSLTGRLLVHLADTFLVQWPELLEVYGPRATYAGSLIDETPPS